MQLAAHDPTQALRYASARRHAARNPDARSASRHHLPFRRLQVTLVGTGFDGYDLNASTARVRFLSSSDSSDALSAAALNASNSSNASSQFFEVVGVRLSATEVVVRAPRVSLDEGELITSRGYPCWNPPCRRVYLSLALNGVDFVGKAEPLEFIYLVDPERWLYLMDKEFWFIAQALTLFFFFNLAFSWHFRFEYYDRYLKLKHWLKNHTVWR